MAQKGQFKPPVEPISKALETAMDMIDSAGCRVALFMVGGKVKSTKMTSSAYGGNLRRLSSALIGVYEQDVDARLVREDLLTFYPKTGVDIDAVHRRAA